MAIPSYIFDPSKGETPESIARQRMFAAQIMNGIGPGRAPQSVGEGIGSAFASIGQGLLARGYNEQADAAEAAGRSQAADLQKQLYGWMTGGATPPAAPSQGAPSTPSAPRAEAPKSQGEFVAQLWPAAVEASQATGVDPRIIVAQAAVESGWGKHAPGNNFFGIKSHGQSGGNTLATTEYGADGSPYRTSASFRAYGSPAESVAGYAEFINQNPRYAAFKAAPDLDSQLNALGRSGYATDPNYANTVGQVARNLQVPTAQVASLDPSAGVNAAGFAPPSAPPQQAPAPVQVAQAGPQGQGATQAQQPRDLGLLYQVASNPWVDPGSRAMAKQMIEQELQNRDPMRQLQMQKLQQDVARGGANEESFYGNPVPVQNPDGTISYGQIGNRGSFKPIQLNQGQTFAPPTKTIDAGTETLIVDQAGNVISRQPKNIAGAEAAKVEGKAQAEAKVNLPTDIANADATVQQIDQLLASPGLPSIVGPLDQFRPSWMMGDSGRDALARYNQLQGRAFLEAYGVLRGGGQITEVEGAKAQSAIARMDRAQGEGQFKAALTDFRDAVKTGLQKMRERAGEPPSQPAAAAQPQPAAQPGAPAVGAVQQGYRFKGGDPANPASWEKVQ